MNSKIDLSRQVKLKELTLLEASEFINEGETILFKKDDGTLSMITKTSSIVEEAPIGVDIIKNLEIPSIPNVYPGVMQAYALCVVRDVFDFKLVWALVETEEEYNVL